MSQADSARIEALEERVRAQAQVLEELGKRIGELEKLAEGDDLMPAVYPENTAPKPGRRSG